MAKKSRIPSIDLKREDFIHAVPDEVRLEVIIHWKGQVKGQSYQPEYINPVKAFAKQDGKFKVINRNLPDTCYTFDIKEIKAVYLMPMDDE